MYLQCRAILGRAEADGYGVVMSVLSDNSNRHITIQAPAPEKGSKATTVKVADGDKPKKDRRKELLRKQLPKRKRRKRKAKRRLHLLFCKMF